MTELLDMGKYGPYIWGAYGASLVVIIGLMVWVLAERKATKTQLRELLEMTGSKSDA